MSLSPGTKIGSYEIVGALGAGGMGVVYRARDKRLQRDVALKLLPDALASDSERLARFHREAQMLASLNHPNIAQIYGLEGSGDSQCIVMELIEGETLEERIRRGAVPLEEALEIATQITEALEAAHAREIVHRDLKPANIKLTPDGRVKVLDFGLAKTLERGPSSFDLSHSPTMVSGTVDRMILGTAAYMSPEQAKGQPADTRSDIWAFGVVLCEMLTGKSLFQGETFIEILGGIMKAEPDWTVLPPATPAAIRSLLRRCLQKDRARRLRDIADARFQIEEALSEPAQPTKAVARVSNRRERVLWAAALFLAIVVTAVAARYLRPPARPVPETRLQIATPDGDQHSFAMSPDGRTVVFQATTDGKTQLWLRPLASDTAQPLGGTENAVLPFWSADGTEIGFFAAGKLRRISIANSTSQIVADAPVGAGGTWNRDGDIVFAKTYTSGLYGVRISGGDPIELTRLDPPRQVSHRYPHFLPDGRRFLFFSAGTADARGVYIGSLDSMDAERLFDADTAAAFVEPDRLLFIRQGTMLSQRFDFEKLVPLGDPVPMAERVPFGEGANGLGGFSVSRLGPVAYRTMVRTDRQMMWFDRAGKQVGTLGDLNTFESMQPRLSPDGRYVTATRRIAGNNVDIWLIETARGILRPVTTHLDADSRAIWSPDGNRLAFASRRTGALNLFTLPMSGGLDNAVLLLESAENKNALDWSPDGRFIAFSSESDKTAINLWALPLAGDLKPIPIAQTSFEENNARFSYDSRWVAYQSNETGRFEIYVQRFPEAGNKWQISTNGGTQPQWRRDDREIVYLGVDGRLMAVPVMLRSNGLNVDSGTPNALFRIPLATEYEATPDLERFLINSAIKPVGTAPINVLLNWAGRKETHVE
jgi:Tol biopolymer transport system component